MGTKRNRVRSRGRLVASVIIVVLILGVCAVAGFKIFIATVSAPVNAADASYVNVLVPSGATTEKIGSILHDNDLIRSVSQFKLLAKLWGYEAKLKSGEYTLSQSMTSREILDVISSGSANTRRFTIPEGYTIAKTADKLENDGFIDKEKFLDAVEHGDFQYKFMDSLPAGPNRLEGFLFPDTYDVFTTATEEDIINRMLAQFDQEFTDEYYVRMNELGYDLVQVITIASMIEAEAKAAKDRPLISSVIYNRLSIGMPLQIDATVQYALGETKERLYDKDTKVDSPYNTYLIKGLPPGPICSPGAGAIYAALYPADTDYLFYVLKPDDSGEHNFANNITEFNKYKAQYKKYNNLQ